MDFDPIEFLRNSVDIPSHEDVTEMRDFLVETIETKGYPTEIDQQGNVLASRDSAGVDHPHLVLNTHIDTVPPHLPFEQDKNRIKGRGACDAKGPLASMLQTFFSSSVNSGQLTLAVTPNEETSQIGGAHLGRTLDADGYIVGEPTDLDVCIAARGNFGGQIKLLGQRAHASDPNAGVNPITMLGVLLDRLEGYDEDRGPGKHDLLGVPTLTPTNVEAGGPLNQIPADCTVSFDRRTVPPETIDDFVKNLEEYLELHLPDSADLKVSHAYPDSPVPDAFVTDEGTELVRILAAESGGLIRTFEGATEASYFASNAPTVVFGPGVPADEAGPVAHSDREYIETSSVIDASRALRGTVEEFVG